MISKKYKSISTKVKKWAKGKPKEDFERFYIPYKKKLESYLLDESETNENEIEKIVSLNQAIRCNSNWNFTKFLELFFEKSETKLWFYLFEAMQFSILRDSLGYTKPKNIGPVNDGMLACVICDALLIEDSLVESIVEGFLKNVNSKKPPLMNPQSVIQLALRLYCVVYEKTYDFKLIFKKQLVDEYSKLIDNIQSPDEKFNIIFNEACEFHLLRSRNSPNYEFSYERYMIIPSELLVVLKIRKNLGKDISNIVHPLVLPFIDFLYLDKEHHTSNLLKSIKKKISNEYLSLKKD